MTSFNETNRQASLNKIALLQESHMQALDATKHQDEKIGRFLTGVAFLTAATLALASLNSAKFTARDFKIPPYQLPLTIISVAIFLLGVTLSVILLLAALTAPLSIPGVTQPINLSEEESRFLWERNRIEGCSPVYFVQISALSIGEWERKWEDTPGRLQKHYERCLIRESHALAARAAFKRDRSSEAVALFSLALLAFAMSTVLIATTVAAPDDGKPVVLEPIPRVALGLVLSSYFWLLATLPIRQKRQDIGKDTMELSRSFLLRDAYALTSSLLIAAVVIYSRPWPSGWWIFSIVVLAIMNISFYLAAVTLEGIKTVIGRTATTILSTLIFAGASAYAGFADLYAWQLFIASCAVAALLVPLTLRPTWELHVRRKNFKSANSHQTGKPQKKV
ncbi:hypothetical protein MQE23_25865 [Streptomyces sp. HP-A2021]|uniref:hypothetical protein n=1 Tax=Streptomyces sp. HP-A2021 TaxID=2927875 RepID=UPI001FAEFF2B|nr:hypothetical protein [Streptomyces sp. HP-A2021]UOB12275.1 hypothetical protein MQE23_25865 [Streptomyces sp. HP-A2021]